MQEFGFPVYSDFLSLSDIPRIKFSTDEIINQAPRTNVGVVALPTGEYTNPRSSAARSLLNYGPSTDDFAPAPETYIRTYPQTFDDLKRTFAPKESTEIYNTELNPYDPSSQFFPYEPDYAGIMSTRAYLEDKGFPLRKDPEFVEDADRDPVSQRAGQNIRTDEDLYGFYTKKNQEEIRQIGKNDPYKVIYTDSGHIYINPFAHRDGGVLDTKELRDTIFHEGKHYFIDNFGQLVPITKGAPYETKQMGQRGGQHGAIYFADIFRNNPFYYNYYMGATDKDAALGFIEMHNYAKNVLRKADKEDKNVLEVLNEDAQDAFRNQQKKNVDEIKEEVKSGGGGPAGMFGTPAGTGQTGGPAGMGFAPSNNPTGFGSNIRIGKAKGGLVSINHLTRGM